MARKTYNTSFSESVRQNKSDERRTKRSKADVKRGYVDPGYGEYYMDKKSQSARAKNESDDARATMLDGVKKTAKETTKKKGAIQKVRGSAEKALEKAVTASSNAANKKYAGATKLKKKGTVKLNPKPKKMKKLTKKK